jgi:hypothetical protein
MNIFGLNCRVFLGLYELSFRPVLAFNGVVAGGMGGLHGDGAFTNFVQISYKFDYFL